MTEKNIFAYQLFLSDFNFFCVKIATPPPLKKEKSHPLFPSNPPLKDEVLSKPPFLKIWPEVQPSPPPPAERGEGGGVHTMHNYHHQHLHQWFQNDDLK